MHDQSQIGMRFDYGYCRRNASNTDSLLIQVSTDCGEHFQTVKVLTGNELSTARDTIVKYFRPMQFEWKTCWLDLSAFDHSPSFIVQMKGIYGGGNNLFVDVIKVGAKVLGMEDPATEAIPLHVYPNPATDRISINGTKDSKTKIAIYTMNGQQYPCMYNSENHTTVINIEHLAAGFYLIEATNADGFKQYGKIVKQ
jgi:hypothetical protein